MSCIYRTRFSADWQTFRTPLQTKHFYCSLHQFATHLGRHAIVFKVTQMWIYIYPLYCKLFTSHKIQPLSQSCNWTVHTVHTFYFVQSRSNCINLNNNHNYYFQLTWLRKRNQHRPNRPPLYVCGYCSIEPADRLSRNLVCNVVMAILCTV